MHACMPPMTCALWPQALRDGKHSNATLCDLCSQKMCALRHPHPPLPARVTPPHVPSPSHAYYMPWCTMHASAAGTLPTSATSTATKCTTTHAAGVRVARACSAATRPLAWCAARTGSCCSAPRTFVSAPRRQGCSWETCDRDTRWALQSRQTRRCSLQSWLMRSHGWGAYVVGGYSYSAVMSLLFTALGVRNALV
jgi:hypothetical protein